MTSADKPRVGVLVLSHGRAAQAMVETARDMLGDDALAGILSVCTVHGEKPELIRSRLEAAAAQVDAGAGILVLCDLYGSTPANLATDLADGQREVTLISGLNLPMLVKLASSDRRRNSMHRLAQAASETARRSLHMTETGREDR